MYLEISSRRSGKSTRLAKEVVDWLVQCKKFGKPGRAVIVVCNQGNVQHIKELIYAEIAKNVIFPGPKGNFDYYIVTGTPTQFQHLTCSEETPVRRFFDEFDFNKNINNDGGFQDLKDDYFCTSPAKIRKICPGILEDKADDLLLRLWIKNGCECISYATYNDQLDRNMFYQLTECQAKFFEISPALLLTSEKKVPTPPIKIVVIAKSDNSIPTNLLDNADIVVCESSANYYSIQKNRFGVENRKIPANLLQKFLSKPEGKLKVDWE